jgi:predicted GNAT family N-acyltransferase
VRVVVSKDAESIKISQAIRSEVFVQEQGIPLQIDLDGLDSSSYHSLVYMDDIAIGVVRLALVGEKCWAHERSYI